MTFLYVEVDIVPYIMGSDELDFSRKAHVKVGHLKNADFIKYSILRFLI